MSPQTAVERDEFCAAMYAGGATLQEIGDLLGVSRERVRQRMARLGVARRESYASAIDPVRLLAACRARGVTSAAEVARRLGIGDPEVADHLERIGCLTSVQRLFRWRRESAARVHIIAALQSLAAQLGRTPTVAECKEVRLYQRRMEITFGSIRGAMQAAGLEPRHSGHRLCQAREAVA